MFHHVPIVLLYFDNSGYVGISLLLLLYAFKALCGAWWSSFSKVAKQSMVVKLRKSQSRV